MPNGKIRHSNHIVDQQACRYLQSVFPHEWVQRTINPDYGLDIDVELFDYENDVCVTLGEHVYLQVKGTEHPNYGTVHPFGEKLYTKEETSSLNWQVIKYNIDVTELLLVERMGAAIPVLLVVVDLNKNQAFYICLNDYISCVLPYQNPAFREQNTVTIYIPTDNILTLETSDICLWYGKRPKLFSLFVEIFSIVDNAKYWNTSKLVKTMKTRIGELVCSDAWNASVHWKLLESIHNMIVEMQKNNLLNIAGKHIIKRNTEPKETMVDHNGEHITAFAAAQAVSCNYFLETVSTMTCIFEEDARHEGLPTKINWSRTKE